MENTFPKNSVDVIVPCYRYGQYLRECVESALHQEGASVRVLIIDDASPDDSAEVAEALVREDSRVSFIRHAVNKGHIATFNEGNDWAAAEYTLLLSADDYLLPGALLRAITLMEQNPDVVFAFGKVIILGEAGNNEEYGTGIEAYDSGKNWIWPGLEFIDVSGAKNIVPTPTPVVRTVHLKRVGGYRPELPHAGDMEMWWRLALHGSVAMIGQCQAAYRRHASNMSLKCAKALLDMRERQAVIDWFLRGCGDRLADASGIQKRAFQSLGEEALVFAHRAFESGDTVASQELLDFAVEVSPSIRGSVPWVKLVAKHRLGPRVFEMLKAVSLSR